MTVPIFFALIGGIILIGFLANLFFRITKIPNVLLLMAIGVILGPVTGWITSDALIAIAPYFGILALLIILFEGGLELDIATVAKEAPRTTLLAILIFVLSVGLVTAFSYYIIGLPFISSLLIACVLGATSPAICIPVVAGLSVRNEIKTILKLESALGDVLLIVSVLMLIDFSKTGTQDAFSMITGFLMSFSVAFVISTIAGVLWSRLIGWMGNEPLAYMLTLGFMFLLYFIVEELHGSAAIAVLMFGLILENMQVIADRFSERIRYLFGINIKAEKFVLNQFIKNITEEISFLVRTFFFVYLGLLLDFKTLTWSITIYIVAIVLLLLFSRWFILNIFKKRNPDLQPVELQVIMAMLPRGLATAVMAFLPIQAGIVGTELFTIYAFGAIVLTNIFMTFSVLFAERRLKRVRAVVLPVVPLAPEAARFESIFSAVVEPESPPTTPLPKEPVKTIFAEPSIKAKHPHLEHHVFSPSEEFRDEPEPTTFTDWMARIFGIHIGDRELGYIEAIKAAYIVEPLFWVQVFLATLITTLGLVLNQSAIIIGGSLIMPIMWPVLSGGLALASGDFYLLLKLLLKMLLVIILTVLISAILSDVLPFSGVTTEIASRIRPTLLDFLIALFSGMAGAALLSRKTKFLQYLPGAIIAITLLPPLCVMGFGFANGFKADIVQGGALLFTANFFANILGAMIIFLLIGMPRAANEESVRDWKEEELSRPLVKLIFERLRLSKIVGRTGSLQARFVVTGIFLLAILIPLQMALNQLNREFRIRQAVSEIEKMFNIPNRSTILNSISYIEENLVTVRIQVATNRFFTSENIARFEERVTDRTGVPTNLDLVQSLSDIGEGTTVRGMLTPSPLSRTIMPKHTFSDIVGDLRAEMHTVLRNLPVPQSIDLISLSAELTMDTLSPDLNLVYLSDKPMTEDALDLLTTLISGRLFISRENVQFSWIRRRYGFDIERRNFFSEEDRLRLQNIHNVLKKFPQLAMRCEYPEKGIKSFPINAVRSALETEIPAFSDSTRASLISVSGRKDSIIIILSIRDSFKSETNGIISTPVR